MVGLTKLYGILNYYIGDRAATASSSGSLFSRLASLEENLPSKYFNPYMVSKSTEVANGDTATIATSTGTGFVTCIEISAKKGAGEEDLHTRLIFVIDGSTVLDTGEDGFMYMTGLAGDSQIVVSRSINLMHSYSSSFQVYFKNTHSSDDIYMQATVSYIATSSG